jgi:phosphate transport system permease protein
MTDLSVNTGGLRRIDTSSDVAKARIKARYTSEARFKGYGIAAIAFTAVFLLVLFADILRKGAPAFWQHSVAMDVVAAPDLIDPSGRRDVEDISRNGDFQGVLRTGLQTMFPDARSREERRRLIGLLSTGAGMDLRDKILANPSLIGQTVRVNALLSDDADLYYKGAGTPMASRPAVGIATPSGTSGEITILTSANDFSQELVAVKQAVGGRAAELRMEADRLTRFGAAAGVDAQIKDLRDRAAALQTRFDTAASAEVLDEQLPGRLVRINGGLVKVTELSNDRIVGRTLLPLRSADDARPGSWEIVTFATPEANRRVSDQEIAWLETLKSNGQVSRNFNVLFFTAGDSREPELAGIRGALIGSILMLTVTLALCLPIGVLAAIYLEEFAPKNKLTDVLEVNINNLAAVPSIVFGLLGLAVFLNFFGLPRSSPLVGGLVLALLVLPTIIIAARAALKAVPPSIKEAALGVGASHQQAVFHHVLPLAMPGIMTGTIIGMAHALGETAPLLMIGMIAFIVDVPKGFTDAATALPVQIFLWSDLPEIAFQAKTAAAIMVLLVFLFLMNGAAIWLRKKFERRW